MAPPSRSGSHPGRALAALGALILVMLIGITGSQTFNPGNWQQQFKVGLGLDLSSGTEVVLKAATTKGAPSSGAMQQAISVLESRVNGTGNSGAQVQQQGADLITVTVPGKAPQDVINLVSSTAKLAFRPVLLEGPYTAPPATTTPSTSPSATPTGTRQVGREQLGHADANHVRQFERHGVGQLERQGVDPGRRRQAGASPAASSTAKASSTPTTSASAKASSTATSTATPTTSASATPTATSQLADVRHLR